MLSSIHIRCALQVFIICILSTMQLFGEDLPYNFLRLNITGGTSTDETVIYFDNSATDNYDEQFDAIKMLSSNPGVPNIYSKIDGSDFSINVLGKFDVKKVVPISLSITQNGQYTISPIEIKDFDELTGIYLEDRVDNKFYNLKIKDKLDFFFNSSTINGRFFIHFNPPPKIEVTNESCLKGDGKIIFTNKSESFWNLELIDSNGIRISKFDSVFSELTIDNLFGGTYSINLSKTEGTKYTLNLEVKSGFSVESEFYSKKDTYKAGEIVELFAKQKFENLIYMWDFGDGESSYDSVVNHIYLYPGIYTITLLVSNGECSNATQKILKIVPDLITNQKINSNSRIKIYPNPSVENINIKVPKNKIIRNIEIIDILGKSIRKYSIQSLEDNKEELNIPIDYLSVGNYFLILDISGTRHIERFSKIN